MPTKLTFVTALAVALCLPAAFLGADPPSESVALNFHKVHYESCAPRTGDRQIEGSFLLESHPARGGPHVRVMDSVWSFRYDARDRLAIRNLRLTAAGCGDGELERLDGGVATVRCQGRRGGTLTFSNRDVRGCTLSGRLSPGDLNRILTAVAPDSKRPRPDPGGPDQGQLAARTLPNLKIRTADPAPGDPSKVAARVVNVGPGASATTRIKIFFHTAAGEVLTAQESVPPLAAGQQAVVEVGVGQPLADAAKITLRVDDPNVVPETSETDNGFIFKK